MMDRMKDFVYQNSIYIIVGVILIFFIMVSIISFVDKKENNVVLENDVVSLEQKPEEKLEFTFDIKGQVKKPGVYKLPSGATVMDAILKSGGLMEQADTTYLNLSRKIKDEMVIIVYSKQEIVDMKSGKENVVVVEGKCECPNISNDACIKKDEVITNQKESNKETNKESSTVITGPINLNTATLEQLDSLPGIGLSKAQDILQYREEHQGFQSVEDLKNVKGIGDAIFEKIKDKIIVS